MNEKQVEILEKYFEHRRDSDKKDKVIDDIFLNEIYWPDGDGNKRYLFKDFESIKKFFENTDLKKKAIEDIPRMCGGEGKTVCGTMARNANICDSINEVICNRIYEELEKRRIK